MADATAERVFTRASRTPLQGDVHVPVILVAYTDLDFVIPNITSAWQAMLSQTGYDAHGAAGSVSDYFIHQSLGKFCPTFDVLGPFTLPHERAYYGENSGDDDRRPAEMIYDACQAAAAQTDFSRYDWDGNGTVDVVLVIFAGRGENQGGPEEAIWPHMSSVGGYSIGGLRLGKYACVSELRGADTMDGYGTLVHEFSHCLGLPDLYPVSGDVISLFDQWDLMDGGNYANRGWSPPNYSAFERNLCGWLDFEELTVPTIVSAMPPLDEEPQAYVIRNDTHPTEYYILENRQQQGFDYYLPNHGLLVTHVMDYSSTLAPNNAYRTQVELVFADHTDYAQYLDLYGRVEYAADGRCHYLRNASYPYFAPDGTVNDSLTTTSVPAMTLANPGPDGTWLLDKPITAISETADGRMSFCFMQPTTDVGTTTVGLSPVMGYYDLYGRRLSGPSAASGLYVVRRADGTTQKSLR